MALPVNIQDQIKKMKGEKKAAEVVAFIKETYPGVKINLSSVYMLWKGSPRKFLKKEKVARGGGRGKKTKHAAPVEAVLKNDEPTIEDLIKDIHQGIDDLEKFFKGVLLAIRGDLLKAKGSLRKSQVVEDPDELNFDPNK